MRLLLPGLGVLLLCLIASGGCRTQRTVSEARPEGNAQPTYFDMTRPDLAPDGKPVDPADCEHMFQQIGIHPYQKLRNGMVMQELCVITRCTKCGEVRHECSPHYRGR